MAMPMIAFTRGSGPKPHWVLPPAAASAVTLPFDPHPGACARFTVLAGVNPDQRNLFDARRRGNAMGAESSGETGQGLGRKPLPPGAHSCFRYSHRRDRFGHKAVVPSAGTCRIAFGAKEKPSRSSFLGAVAVA